MGTAGMRPSGEVRRTLQKMREILPCDIKQQEGDGVGKCQVITSISLHQLKQAVIEGSTMLAPITQDGRTLSEPYKNSKLDQVSTVRFSINVIPPLDRLFVGTLLDSAPQIPNRIQQIDDIMSCFASFELLCRKIVAPTRQDINESDLITRKFRGKPPLHHTINVANRRGQALSVLLFPKDMQNYPTVLYLHGNGGNKLELLNIVKHSQAEDVNFCAFDFSGCGKSDGEFITYGEPEVQDIASVVRFLRDYFGVTNVSIWGRSMGASLGMMYAAECAPGVVSSMVLDSPFRDLEKVLMNVASYNQQVIPKFVIRIGIYFVRRKIRDLVKRDVFEEDYSTTLPVLHQRKIPILFGFSRRDTVVTEDDVTELYNLYQGEKYLYEFSCLHPEDRPESFVKTALKFIAAEASEKKGGWVSVHPHTERHPTTTKRTQHTRAYSQTHRQ